MVVGRARWCRYVVRAIGVFHLTSVIQYPATVSKAVVTIAVVSVNAPRITPSLAFSFLFWLVEFVEVGVAALVVVGVAALVVGVIALDVMRLGVAASVGAATLAAEAELDGVGVASPAEVGMVEVVLVVTETVAVLTMGGVVFRAQLALPVSHKNK